MSRRTLAVALLGAAALAVGTAGVARAQDQDPPAVAQLCAATSIDEVDDLLASIADSDLVQSLDGLVTLTVPENPRSATVKGDVDLAAVKTKLDCATTPVTPEPTAEPTPTDEPTPTTGPSTPVTPVPVFYDNCDAARAAGVTPIARGSEGYRPGLDADGDGVACEDNEAPVSGGTTTDDGVGSSTTPVGGVDTGRW